MPNECKEAKKLSNNEFMVKQPKLPACQKCQNGSFQKDQVTLEKNMGTFSGVYAILHE